MARNPSSAGPAPRLCPTCGTRVGLAATKCLVCGSDLTGGTQPIAPVRGRAATGGTAQRSGGLSFPTISLPLPAVLAAIGMFVVLGLILILWGTGNLPGGSPEPTATIAVTATQEATLTAAPTSTETPAPTATPLPPAEYTVQAGDTVGGIAVAFGVSIQSILTVNQLDPASVIAPGQVLLVPLPTPTLTPEPSATLEVLEQTAVARPTYVVQEGDTGGGIARFYNVDPLALAEVNNLPNLDQIRAGTVLIIPVDRPPATEGPEPTGTAPPPYAAPQLLFPADGAVFAANDDSVVLQWATVDILREGEVYWVHVVDVTCNCARELGVPTTENRLIVPLDIQPDEPEPHIFRWTIVIARRTGVDARGQDIYEPAGATSVERVFTWFGDGGASPTRAPGEEPGTETPTP